MMDVLTNHQWDDKYKTAENKRRESNNSSNRGKNNDTGQDGKSDGKLLAQTVIPKAGKDPTNITCYCCGEKGHYSTDCEKQDKIPKDKWFKIIENK